MCGIDLVRLFLSFHVGYSSDKGIDLSTFVMSHPSVREDINPDGSIRAGSSAHGVLSRADCQVPVDQFSPLSADSIVHTLFRRLFIVSGFKLFPVAFFRKVKQCNC